MILTKNEKVKSDMTDAFVHLSPVGFFQIAEETLTELMGELKIDGVTAKEKYNAIWVFSKSKLRIYKNIKWNEQYTSIGFISKITPVTIHIDVEVRNGTSELCGYLRVELCALDLQSGKIRKVSTVGVNDCIQSESSQTDLRFSKFDTDNLHETEQLKVRYTSIDYAGHTNNKEYIKFVLNTYSVNELKARPIKEMDIIYINQTFENDILTIFKGFDKGRDIFAIKKDDKYVIKCEVVRSE
ncbi:MULTISPECIES: acyl-ACP thioesterase domain-containing protein [unclassified Ruminococcus]|uniref:acyl-ACP thioesterase domain-containing protein n=1 Tax=unclassified Ruminococcus TaxID=2608920 RepID=UPI00210CDD84|nr:MULTISPECIES: acyl-ACP thioesterase domain-containing protein [unclassified Ruminococcus]MCQ4023348.1 hypothetical protein [Ruminococcus sp. zg-924]MCQ4115372.1 hypothetical protein [Ruminococcus sp. zg-921]